LPNITQIGDDDPEGAPRPQADERRKSRWETSAELDPVFGLSAIEEIVQVIDPQALGLEPVSDRKFVAKHGHGFRILEIPAFKGAAYGLRWGVGLPYVPLAWKRPLRFGRTLKSSRLSLGWGSDRDDGAPHRLRYIGTFHGMRAVRDDTVEIWDYSKQAVLAFWHETVDLPGVLTSAMHQYSLPSSKFYVPNAGVVAALTAARLGDESGARQLASEAPTYDHETELLRELIDQYLPHNKTTS
jgi:hypothetical protein